MILVLMSSSQCCCWYNVIFTMLLLMLHVAFTMLLLLNVVITMLLLLVISPWPNDVAVKCRLFNAAVAAAGHHRCPVHLTCSPAMASSFHRSGEEATLRSTGEGWQFWIFPPKCEYCFKFSRQNVNTVLNFPAKMWIQFWILPPKFEYSVGFPAKMSV